MLKLINKIYKKDRVTLDLIGSLTKKFSECENKINDLYKQIFLNSADWYLELKELEMSIGKRLDDIDKRRNYVRARLLGVGTATKEMLESAANSIDGIEVEISFRDMTVIVRFLKAKSNRYLSMAKRSIENMKPYHLDMILEYEHVNWGEIKGNEDKPVTWGELPKYTWESISKSVAGTVLEEIDDDFD